MESLRIAVTGATGLVGTALCSALAADGHTVEKLVRRPPGPGERRWNPEEGTIDDLSGVDVVVHLAGEPIARRWTEDVKRRVMESREKGTRLVAQAVVAARPRALLSASAVGVYGDRGDQPVDESSPPGTGFCAEVCRRWEAATAPASEAGIRVVNLRIGVVLSQHGGALRQMLPPARLGLGGPLGSGRQYVPWIALDDVVGANRHLLGSELAGPVNLVAPNPLPQAQFTRELGAWLHRPAFLPLPAFAVRAMFGEMGQELLLAGQRVAPAKLLADGYTFLRPTLPQALEHA